MAESMKFFEGKGTIRILQQPDTFYDDLLFGFQPTVNTVQCTTSQCVFCQMEMQFEWEQFDLTC